MSKQPPKKITPNGYARRFAAESAALQREYCTTFKFWRACPVRACRKARRCVGDESACLRRGLDEVPRLVQWRARQHLIASTPGGAGPPERMARACMPADLLDLQARREREIATGAK